MTEREKETLFEDAIETNLDEALVIAKTIDNKGGRGGWESTLLHKACAESDLAAVKVLIEAGFDKNQYFEDMDHCTDVRGTPLTQAIDHCADEVIEYLLQFDDLDVCRSGYSKDSEAPYWVNGDMIIPFNKLIRTPYIERIVELGGSPDDCDEDDNLLWEVLANKDLVLFDLLMGYGVNTNIEGEYGPFLHQVLTKYLENEDSQWLKIIARVLEKGFDLTTQDVEFETFMSRIVKSYDPDLLKLVGLDKEDMEEVAEYYEKPWPREPYVLFDETSNSEKNAKEVIRMTLEGYYGWRKSKLIRIFNLAVAVLEEEHGEEISFMSDELERMWGEVKYVPFRYFMNEHFSDVDSLEKEYQLFIDSLHESGNFKFEDKSFMYGLSKIETRIEKMKSVETA